MCVDVSQWMQLRVYTVWEIIYAQTPRSQAGGRRAEMEREGRTYVGPPGKTLAIHSSG